MLLQITTLIEAKATVDGMHRYFGSFAIAEHAALACARGIAAAARRAAAAPEPALYHTAAV